jgi:prepilin-type N-terminal cleavage/methylation domain-containing protein
MNGSHDAERGFTLPEVVVVMAILVLMLASIGVMTFASHPAQANAAALRFKSAVDAAKSLAQAQDGATLYFTTQNGPANFRAQIYAGRPGNAVAAEAPDIQANATVSEATLGNAPFALVFHAGGLVGGLPGASPGGAAASELPCPASGSWTLTFSAGNDTRQVAVPCVVTVLNNGVAVLAPTPTPEPSIAPPGGPCLPGFTFSGGACVGPPPAGAPTPIACPSGFTGPPNACAPAATPAPFTVIVSPASASVVDGTTNVVTVSSCAASGSCVAGTSLALTSNCSSVERTTTTTTAIFFVTSPSTGNGNCLLTGTDGQGNTGNSSFFFDPPSTPAPTPAPVSTPPSGPCGPSNPCAVNEQMQISAAESGFTVLRTFVIDLLSDGTEIEVSAICPLPFAETTPCISAQVPWISYGAVRGSQFTSTFPEGLGAPPWVNAAGVTIASVGGWCASTTGATTNSGMEIGCPIPVGPDIENPLDEDWLIPIGQAIGDAGERGAFPMQVSNITFR